MKNNININIHFTEVAPSTYEGFRIPMTDSRMYPEVYRKDGYTAKVVDFNRLIISTPYGYDKEYVVSYELSGTNSNKMMERDSVANVRFWRAVEGVVMVKLANIVRYINRHSW